MSNVNDRIDAGTRISGLTVGDLKKELEIWLDDMVIAMNGLTFYRFKQRDDKLLQMEFNQVVYLDDLGIVRIQHVD
ncbi:hypothetical protein [Akkermansia glycaniphila]|uniref:Uncharacterized protein n=1 Tax=Akkermansia glycaniphila TaxID=1679444 RepID=A0A1C7PB43_9BACT|nr:hypothetical protein [Akkermansia glycaniphila]OCA02755.1 hypothetical protein AC781_08675 [Akkermansia glycaniphila]SEH99906.1 Hypothetical protein PYTT_2442 [Akkermansia glycaniphila]